MTAEKLKAFLTIPLVSGYARLPRQEMYWEIREDCHNLVVSAMMKKAEFLQCKQYLHLADNNALNSSDKFAKVRPLFNAINKECVLNYRHIQHLSVDESTVPYSEKHEAKQYIHGKNIKFGFKLWVMATLLGSCIQFRPYAGKDSILEEYLKHRTRSLCISSCKQSNYHIAMENCFTSPALLWRLRAIGVLQQEQ